jgi:coenzyme Q-binding protein COQ10
LHKTHLTRHLPYAPEELFRLVGDVEAYPKFLPWVSSMRTWNRAAPEEGVRTMDAEAKVGFAFVRERFATRVRLDEIGRRIDVSLLYGPFKRLKNSWWFAPDDGGTRIEFDIDFEFKSRILDALLAANLRHAAERVIACFESRAEALYGARAAAG